MPAPIRRPSRTTHNTLLEVAWTLIPVVILVGIAIPSFRLLFYQLTIPAMSAEAGDVTIKATGRQWYWTYGYPDHGNFEFDSRMVRDQERIKCRAAAAAGGRQRPGRAGQQERPRHHHRRRGDPCVRGAVVRHQDRFDPGRINETWFRATREGIYYGQCSELCGKDHAYMPIAVRVVSEERSRPGLKARARNSRATTATPPRSRRRSNRRSAERYAPGAAKGTRGND